MRMGDLCGSREGSIFHSFMFFFVYMFFVI